MTLIERPIKDRGPNWFEVAQAVKFDAGWKCERCGLEHGKTDPADGKTVFITVVFKDRNPANWERSNLEACCSRCAPPAPPVAQKPVTTPPLFFGIEGNEFPKEIQPEKRKPFSNYTPKGRTRHHG